MNKLSLIGMEKDKEPIIKALMKLGCVDIIDSTQQLSLMEEPGLAVQDGDSEGVLNLQKQIDSVKSAINYLSKFDNKKKGLFAPKRSISQKEYDSIIENQQKVWDVVNKIEQYDKELADLRSEQNRLSNMIDSLKPWEKLEIPVEDIKTRSTIISTGTLPSMVEMQKFREQIDEQLPASYFEIISDDKDQYYVLIIYHKALEEDADRLLKQNGYTKVSFKEITGTIKENIEKFQSRIEEIEKYRPELEKKIAELVNEKENLEVLYDYLVIQKDRKEILSKVIKTEHVFMLEGWLPAECSKSVEEKISKGWDCYIDIREPEKDEEYPIELRNNKLVQPFEMITEMYSLPKPNGIDPNPFMAPFFFAFFGLMVSDAGYGLLMAIAAGIMLIKFKPQGMAGKLIKLIFFGGISTFIWGALFGGWFGDIAQLVSGGKFAIKPIWFNPMENPMKLLIWSMVFGVIQLFVAMGLQAYLMIRDGKVKDAIFDIGFYMIFLLGLMSLLVGGTIATAGKYMAIAGAILMVLTQGRNQKNIFKKFTSGVLSLYNAVGFMSDVLSYSRLLALGLSTGVVASVINTMGTLMGFSIPGMIVLVVVFIIGHIFNMAINVLGAYVHASRLQYVEFFGKFYEGGGKAFKPFKINTKYINVDDRRTE